MTGRTLAVGDIHGCHNALVSLLDAVALTPQDTIVFLGDAVDRGPDSKLVVDEILSLQNLCDIKFIAGNHEEMMRSAISGRGLVNQWLESGGQATVDSYRGFVRRFIGECSTRPHPFSRLWSVVLGIGK